MRKSIVAIAILAFFAFSLVPAFAADKCCDSKTKSTVKQSKDMMCPVMGGKVTAASKKAGKSVYKGKTYYFCCPSCKTAFDKDPAKYIKASAKKTGSVACQMTGKKTCDMKNGGTCPYSNGKMSGTCPKATVKKTEKKVVSAMCPVMGSKIPDVSKAAGKSVYKGKTYYFCCSGCKPLFDKNPGKYIKK